MADPIEAAARKLCEDDCRSLSEPEETLCKERCPQWRLFTNAAQAAIAAFTAAGGVAVPEGMVAVSKGPTQKAVDEIKQVLTDLGFTGPTETECAYLYQAMIAAAEKG